MVVVVVMVLVIVKSWTVLLVGLVTMDLILVKFQMISIIPVPLISV